MEISENDALPTSRERTIQIEKKHPRQQTDRYDKRGPRKPLNQVERPIVFSYSTQVQTVRDILISLHGDASPERIQSAAEAYLAMGDTSAVEADISDVFVKAFSSLPVEIPAIATLVSIVYAPNVSFMSTLMTKLSTVLIDSLQNGMKGIFATKMILRSLSCFACCGVLAMDGAGGVISVLRSLFQFIDVSASSAATVQEKTRGDLAAYLLVNTLPWLATPLQQPQYAHFLLEVEKYTAVVLASWSSDFDIDSRRAIFQVNVTDEAVTEGPSGCACWDNLWDGCTFVTAMIEDIKGATYQPISCLVPPCVPFLDAENYPDLYKINSAQSFALAADLHANLVSTMEQSTWKVFEGASAALKSWRNVRFAIFDADAGENAAAYASLSSAHKYILGEYVRDVLVFFEPLGLEDGTRVGSVQLAASHALAVMRLFEGSSHAEYGVVETLLLLLLQPAEHDSMYLCSVLLELCKLAPSLVPPVLAAGCGVLFQLAPALDTSSWRNLGRYLQFHLANFKLSWPYWSHWEGELENAAYGADDAMRALCSLVIDGCARIMFRASVTAALPPKLQELVPTDDPPALPLFGAQADVNDPRVAVAATLVEKIELREGAESLEDWLDSDHEGVDDAAEGECWRGVLLVQAVVFSSHRVPSALLLALDTYRDLIRTFLEVEGGQDALMQSLASMYHSDGAMLNFMIDNLIRRSILQAAAVVKWAFSAEVIARLTRDVWLWSHITLALERSIDAVRAALSMREQLYGDDDTSADHVQEAAMEGTAADDEVMAGLPAQDDDDDEVDMDDDEEDEGGGRRRRRTGRIQADREAIRAANVALAAAVQSCNALCTQTCVGIFASIELKRSSLATDDELDPFLVASVSLLRCVLRTAFAAQDGLMEVVAVFLAGSSTIAVILDKHAISAQSGSIAPIAAVSWNNFAHIV